MNHKTFCVASNKPAPTSFCRHKHPKWHDQRIKKFLSVLYSFGWFIFQSSKGVFQQFPKFLSNASKEQPLVIMLDSLDQLSPLHGARKLTWFPRKLPAHVKFIVSTLPDQEYKCFPILKVMYEIDLCRIVFWDYRYRLLLGEGVAAIKWLLNWIQD